jgi:Tfp pilus assembly protein PilN
MISKLGLSTRDRRTIRVGLLTVSLLLGVAKGVPALRHWEGDQKSEARAAAQQIASLRRGLAILPAIRDTLRARQDRLAALDSILLSGVSPSTIAATLASQLEDFADDNAVKVTALQLHADTAAIAGLARVDVRITAVADIYGLTGFLHAVESEATPLVVRDLNVSQPEPMASDAKPEALRVDVLVSGIGIIKAAKLGARP